MSAPVMVRTRFAPSPTGLLHVGGARTALFNWLYAKKMGGRFVLRIEDTDAERSKREYEDNLIEALNWLGLHFDEGPYITAEDEDLGPYRQSERFHLHFKYAQKLLATGHAYKCYCSAERLGALRKEQVADGVAPGYDGKCRGLKEGEAPAGVEPVIRFNVPDKRLTYVDGLRGEVVVDATLLADFIILDSTQCASFLFSSALDDSLMKITDVIRGDDHISNTARQILLLEALGFIAPRYSHIPLVLGPDRKPLSKREHATSIRSLRNDGFLPGAVINAIARLGWAPGPGFKTLKELSEEFSLKALSKSAACFDIKRLRRFNKDALKAVSPEYIIKDVARYFKKVEIVWLTYAVAMIKDDADSVNDVVRLLSPLIGVMTITHEAERVLKDPGALAVIRVLAEEITLAEVLSEDKSRDILTSLKGKTGKKGKELFMPIRAALTGCTSGFELFKVLILLGKLNALERLNAVLSAHGQDVV